MRVHCHSPQLGDFVKAANREKIERSRQTNKKVGRFYQLGQPPVMPNFLYCLRGRRGSSSDASNAVQSEVGRRRIGAAVTRLESERGAASGGQIAVEACVVDRHRLAHLA
jgi:hypothetical protein